ncbi:MAG TPA: TlpA disulfide reductase family protein, partial [Prolixibacteraceae bacterium]|nr:TlpA disulfide reductase family protein [Prolixibacteraceae bacterium]
KKVQTLTQGNWRGVFVLPGNEIPFSFEVKEKSPGSLSVFLINGSDRFELSVVTLQNDSVTIPVDLYSAVFKAKIEGNTISGRFIKLGSEKPDTGLIFTAEAGDLPRFSPKGENPSVSLDGSWDMLFGEGADGKNYVGSFSQNEMMVTGSVLTPSGDFRFLEGVVRGKTFELSAFGGSTPYLLKGEFSTDTTFTGEFITPRSKTPFSGSRNSKAALPDSYTVTRMKQGFTTLGFSFPNLEGQPVSLTDEKYKGKVVIVTILGSWCPNCLDENAFLAEWYKKNQERGVGIIGLGFERKADFESGKKSLGALKTRLDIPYEILFAGKSGTDNVSVALPELEGFAAFPTTIFIDKMGKVRKIHSGFNGPATGKFHEEFKAEFNALMDELL